MAPTGISPGIQRERGFTVNKGNPINFQTILLGLSHIKLNLVFLEDPKSAAYSLLISTQSGSNFCLMTVFQLLEGSESYPFQPLLLGAS